MIRNLPTVIDNQNNEDFWLSSFRSVLLLGKIKRGSISNYLSDIKGFLSWFDHYLKENKIALPAETFGEKMNLIDEKVIDLFVESLKNENSIKSINRRLSSLRKFGTYCRSQLLTRKNSFENYSNLTTINSQQKVSNDISLLILFRQYLDKSNIKNGSALNYLSDMRSFFIWVDLYFKKQGQILNLNDSSLLVSKVSRQLINEYLNELKRGQIPVLSLNRRISTLKKFGSFLLSQNLIIENIFDIYQKETPVEVIPPVPVINPQPSTEIEKINLPHENLFNSPPVTEKIAIPPEMVCSSKRKNIGSYFIVLILLLILGSGSYFGSRYLIDGSKSLLGKASPQTAIDNKPFQDKTSPQTTAILPQTLLTTIREIIKEQSTIKQITEFDRNEIQKMIKENIEGLIVAQNAQSNKFSSIEVGITSLFSVNEGGVVTDGTWHGDRINIAYGGTGTNQIPLNGQLLIGNGSNYTLANLTAGTDITISNAPGQITIAHADPGSQGSSENSNGTVIQSLVLDTLNHVTGIGTVNLDDRYLGVGATIGISKGGTGLAALPTSGQILIGNASGGYTLSSLTAGAGVSITNGSGSITISSSSSSGSGTTYSANNGITLASGFFGLGGQLSQLTTVDQNSNNIGFWNTGNVGIGNTNPAYQFDVTGDGRFTSNLSVGASISVTDNVKLSGVAVGTGTTAVFIDADGNLSKRVLGTNAFSSATYDNYASWNLQVNGAGTTAVLSNNIVNFANGTGISVSQNGSTITITNIGSGATYSADNGITLASGYIQLGGQLSQLTKINQNSNNFGFYGGNVGVGTTSPTAGFILDVAGNLRVGSSSTLGDITSGAWYGSAIAPQYGGTGINGATAPNGNLLIGNGSGYALNTLTAGAGISITNGSGSITITATGTGTGTTYAANNGITLASGFFGLGGQLNQLTKIDLNSNSINFWNTGNFGIGTTNPGDKLEVKTDPGGQAARVTINGPGVDSYNGFVVKTLGTESWFMGRNGTELNDDLIFRASNTTDVIKLVNAGAAANTLVLKAGKVGIGTTEPTQALDVNGSVNVGKSVLTTSLKITGGAQDTYILQSDAFGNATWVAPTTGSGTTYSANNGITLNGSNFFQLGGTLNQLTKIDQSSNNIGFWGAGNIGIGTTNPAYKLDVNGDTNIGGSFSTNSNVNLSGLTVGTGTTAVFVDTSGNLTKRVLGTNAFSSAAYDNYQYWQLQANGTGTTSILPTNTVNFANGTGISMSQTGSTITINNTSMGTTYSANNGITLASGFFQLGGQLNQLTKIDLNGNNLGFWNTGNFGIGTTSPTATFTVNSSVTSGNAASITANSLTTGKALTIIHNGDPGSGGPGPDISYKLLDISDTRSGAFVHSGTTSRINIAENRTYNGGVSTTETTNYFNIDRTSIVDAGINGFNVAGALMRISSTDSITNGLLNNTANLLSLAQNCGGTTCTGSVLKILGKGTGDLLEILQDTTAVLNVKSTGNVGIGVLAPTQKLDINGNINIGGTGFSTSFKPGILLDNGSFPGSAGQILTSTATGVSWIPGNAIGVGTTYSANNGITLDGSNFFQLGGQLNQLTKIDLNSNNIGFWNTGNIGIGTTNLTSAFQVGQGIGGTAGFVVTSDGKVGIGTTSPAYRGLNISLVDDGAVAYAIYNTLNTNNNNIYGMYNDETVDTSSETGYGVYNAINATVGATGIGYGVYNNLDAGGTLAGTYNDISSTAAGNSLYGAYNDITVAGTSSKGYGSYTTITTTAANGQTGYGDYVLLKTAAGDSGYGSYVIDNLGTSTGGTQYGYYVNLDDVDVTNYSIYVESGSGKSYFGSNVGIGTTNVSGIFQVGQGIGGTPQMLIKENGNIGIGTTSPTQKLEVIGSAKFSNDINNGTKVIVNGPGADDSHGFAIQTNGTESWYLGRNGPAASEDLILKNNNTTNVFTASYNDAVADTLVLNAGNVGIRTATPMGLLQVGAGTGNTSQMVVNANGFIGLVGQTSPQSPIDIFERVNTQRTTINMVNTSGGNAAATSILIGTSNATTTFGYLKTYASTFAGTPRLNDTFYVFQGSGLGGLALGTESSAPIKFITNGSNNYALSAERMRIDVNGNVGIGTTSPTALFQIGNLGAGQTGSFIYVPTAGKIGIGNTVTNYSFQVGSDTRNGNGAYVTNAGVWTNGSSRTFKEDYQPINKQDLLNKIMNLEIYNFKYKDSTDRGISPFAEDFFQAFGLGGSEKYLAPGHVAGVALVAIQEQQIQIASLSAQLNFTDSGNLAIETSDTSYNGLLSDNIENQNYSLKLNTGETITRIGGFAELIAGKVKAGLIKTTNLIVENKVVSPLIETTQLKSQKISTDIISPLSSKNLTLDLSNLSEGGTLPESGFGKLLVKGNAEFTGNVGIGTTNPGYRVQLPNVADASGQGLANAWKTYSSMRWNDNVRTIDNSLEKIGQLNPIYFDWKPEKGGAHDIGFIAEEVGKVVPEVVTWEDNGVDAKAVDYSKLTSLAIKGIQEQQQQIASLSARLQLLENTSIKSSSDTLTASQSALLANVGLGNNATVSGDLMVLGKSTLSDVSITGKITSGFLTIEGMDGQDGSSISTLSGPLRLQANALGNLEIMDGKVLIDTSGNLNIEGTFTAKKINIDESDTPSKSIGEATILAGQLETLIETTSASESSRIFVSPKDKPVLFAIKDQQPGSFKIIIDAKSENDLKFSYWVIN